MMMFATSNVTSAVTPTRRQLNKVGICIPRQLQSFLSLTPPTSQYNIHIVRAAEHIMSPCRRTRRPQLRPLISLLQLGFFRRGCCGLYGGGFWSGCRCGCRRECCGCAGAGAGITCVFLLVRIGVVGSSWNGKGLARQFYLDSIWRFLYRTLMNLRAFPHF